LIDLRLFLKNETFFSLPIRMRLELPQLYEIAGKNQTNKGKATLSGFFINFTLNSNNLFTNPPYIDRVRFPKCRPLCLRKFHALIYAS
jgi:hypothetical protein